MYSAYAFMSWYKNILILDPSPENAASNFYKYCPNYYVCGCPQTESIMNHPGIQKMNLDFIKVYAVGGDTVTPAFEERANKFLKTTMPIRPYLLATE